jgi:DNA polymerase-3 subunit epsilon
VARSRLSLRGRMALLSAAFGAGALAVLGAGLSLGWRHAGADGFMLAGVIAGFGLFGLIVWLWFLLDTHIARPVDQLAGVLRARVHGDVMDRIDPGPARHLGDLGPAAADLAAGLGQARTALAKAVARETTRLTGEKTRLEALLADVPVGVLLCSDDHLLAFYNGPAVEMIGAGAGDPGLDRRLFDFLRDGPIRMAHARLTATGDPGAASDLLATTRDGGRVLAARMRLRPGMGGYVLTLRDVTADLATHARREALLAEAMDRMRRPAATLASLIGALAPGEAPPVRLDAALRDEVAKLVQSVADLTDRHEAGRSDGLPLATTRAADLTDGARARIEAEGITIDTRSTDLLLTCNGFELIALIAGLGVELGRAGFARDLTLDIGEEGSGALIRLMWQGASLKLATLDGWLEVRLEPGLDGVTRRDVLLTHATDIWPESSGGGQALCLPMPHARRAVTRPAPVPRAVVYDFDLSSRERSASVEDSFLGTLTYVVFDTETTGLRPDQGDEIVQIAAVRIVNGRRVEGEVFDTLVNPGRAIPAVSTAVHGITDAMVADAPMIGPVLARFHAFAEGAVLVAHNAPFDMAFLRRHGPAQGLAFDHPILDTVLLSAVVFGQHDVHSLDALTQRLGVTLPEEARHTAIGDTMATAEVFQKLLGMVQGRGLATFGSVLAEVRRHGRLLKDLN